ncbi:sulfatase-like hydrolase/transferase [Planctomycetales bacterium ZRK34]|nr:sulfatase-like hydrolase/transferase [Planctomycetales bacterium ZRK34]
MNKPLTTVRSFIRLLALTALLFAATFRADVVNAAAEGARPNIVFILADDLGYGDLACYGRQDIKTPNLDRLARQGVRFTNHYANGPECSPTRTALLTGRYQQWVGGLECAIGTGNVGRYDDAIRLRETHDLGLPTEEQTIVRLLKDAGYATAITGKWHLGYEPKFAPNLHGFDYTFYCIGGGMDYFYYLDTVAGYNLFQDGRPIHREGYFTDLMTDEAIAYIKQPRDKPFFLYVPYTCPHAPFQGPDDLLDDPLPLDSPLWNQSKSPPEVYIAMIEHMDKRIGDLLRTLDDEGIAQNTVVIFASDNGGTRSARNAPLSGHKGSTLEGGIRVPAMARWPGVIPAGTVCDQPCITFDFTASMARIGGATPAADKPLEGIDILQHVAEAKTDFDRTLYWRKPRGQTIWMGVRQGALKFVARRKGDSYNEHLYDLASDVGEQHDLKDARPNDLARLKKLYLTWEQTVRQNRRGRPE